VAAVIFLIALKVSSGIVDGLFILAASALLVPFLAVLMVSFELVHLGSIPPWTGWAGGVGAITCLVAALLSRLPAGTTSGQFRAGISALGHILVLVFWVMLGIGLVAGGEAVVPASNKRIERTPRALS
jgi:hypothetical protein